MGHRCGWRCSRRGRRSKRCTRRNMESERRLCTDGSAEGLMVASLRAGGLEMGFQALAEA